MSKLASYMMDSEFLEDQVEKDVASYLGYISKLFGRRYRLLQIDEAVTGADAQFNWKGSAFYFQFKKPTGLKSVTTVALPTPARKNEAREQQIRRYRIGQGLAERPFSLFFQLREKAKTANDYQHNILLSYERPPLSRAMYVCPTVLTRHEYEKALNVPWLRRFFEPPLRFRDYDLYVNDVAHYCATSPLLRAHATIVPHATVSSADHYYSFSFHGSDVAFHSPEVVRHDVSRLSDVLSEELLKLSRNPESFGNLTTIARAIAESQKWTLSELPQLTDENSLDWLRMHGRVLRDRHRIRQFIMLLQPSRGTIEKI